MSIRLGKAAKDLNVGISTAVSFLGKRGHEVAQDPNVKITEDQYALLVKEFSTDKLIKEQSERLSQQQRHKEKSRESKSIDGYASDGSKKAEKKTEKKPEQQPVAEIKTEVSEELKPHFKMVGKMDLDVPKKQPEKPAVQPTVKAEEKPLPIVIETKKSKPAEKPAVQTEEKVEEQPVVTEKKEAEVFSLGKPTLETTPNVIGKIDLSSLNQQTRPAPKTKEEKRKAREERIREEKAKTKQQRQQAFAPRQAEKNDKSDKTEKREPRREEEIFKLKSNSSIKLTVVDKIELPANTEGLPKKKRKRIQKERVDINNVTASRPRSGGGGSGGGQKSSSKSKRPVKAEISEEDVQKQIKETLARLTGGKKGQGAKHRREKRDTMAQRREEIVNAEEMASHTLQLTEFVTANELAAMMNVPVVQVISVCMNLGLMVSINQRLDAETINIVADEFGYTTEFVSSEVVDAVTDDEPDAEEDLESRPPIVTVMGHVDHGKTSLLDHIRKTNVIAGEAGGITQHIGAYNVRLKDGRHITFLDTPGHEAFTAMRARGAKLTDIAIIIVAADDDIMPQTKEAISHASAANVPIVFAINKIDKPGANPEKIKEGLANMNYLVEEWGGKYQSQDISAKAGTNVEELLEKVLLEAELLDLKANPNRRAVGSVIESTLDKGRGYVAKVMVQNGTLRMGDVVLAGTWFGKVKAMFNERNQRIKEAGPAEPVLILGLNGAPQAGDNFNVMETEQEAREIANRREQLQREQGLRTKKHLTLDELGRRIALGNFQELNIIVKGDVDGSIEALSDSLIKLSTPEIQVNVIHKAVGAISESDVNLAVASNAIIIGFQVRPVQSARRLAEKEEIDIRTYSVIYDAIEEMKSAMEGMLSPEIKEVVTATIEVREVFNVTKVGTVAGCLVREGKVKRTDKVRLIRDGIVIYSGEIGSLKRVKDDVKEVATNYECGLNIQNYSDVRVGDMIESYEEVEVKKTL